MEKGVQFFWVLGFSILIGGVTGYFAEQRGRNPFLWFFIGMFFGFLGLLVLFLLPSAKKENVATPRPEEREDPRQVLMTPPPVLTEKPLEQREWFYLDLTHQQQGPVSFQEVERLWKENQISARTYLWSEGMGDWKRIELFPELLEKFEDKKEP